MGRSVQMKQKEVPVRGGGAIFRKNFVGEVTFELGLTRQER